MKKNRNQWRCHLNRQKTAPITLEYQAGKPNEALKESGFGSLKACNSVFETIQGMGCNVRLSICTTKGELDDVVQRKPRLVILAVKYIFAKNEDDIWLSAYFSRHGINFTGSSREVLKFDSNKVFAKTHLTNKGI